MLPNKSLLFAVTTALTLAGSLSAADTSLESGPKRTHLLELYTSEGCSSCPPAEAWLSRLKDDAGLWRDFVPVAFHVDYWDRLGWRDPFASKAWTARQYGYSAQWNSGSVYTPEFVLDGREWHNNGTPSAGAESPGALKVSLRGGDKVSASFQPAKADATALELHVARLGFGLNVHVKAGENSGRKLLHDFVVLSLVDGKMAAGKAEVTLPSGTALTDPNARTALVAWVTAPGRMEPLQAVGGWIR
ncbi:MAG: DUF1223 domain-containing protein [Verrucomicrobiota bacterium]|nr:DUF1223 domain-containing protein [Verrucomicrobiota bacterium]